MLVSELAKKFDAHFVGEDFEIEGVAALSKACSAELSFWTAASVSGEARSTNVGAAFVPKNFEGKLGNARALIFVADAYVAMVRYVEEFILPVEYAPSQITATAQIHPSAVVEGVVGENAVVGPNCTVMRGGVVGEGTVLEANVTVYGGARLGKNCVVQAGAVIGSRGFGFYFEDGTRKPVPHVAGVVIGDGCGIGANSIVAAGFLSPTCIGNNTQLDTLVQIGHNCTVGNNVYMASQCALAGTTVVEDDVEMGGAAKASGHLTIGKGARIAAKAGVTRSVPAGKMYAGFPAQEISEWRKGILELRKLTRK